MNSVERDSSCDLSPKSNSAPADRKPNGYVLLVLLVFSTLLLISLSAALPSLTTQAKREREEELIFRGRQYERAIALFHRQFNRHPTSVKELLRSDRMRFLRRTYEDPMTRDGQWRFIYADASGQILDSSSGSSKGTTAIGENRAAEDRESSRAMSFFSSQKRPVTSSKSTGVAATGRFLVGVASTSSKNSIKVWRGKTRYDEWEFLTNAGDLSESLPAVQAPD